MTTTVDVAAENELCLLFDEYAALLAWAAAPQVRFVPGLYRFAVEHVRRTVVALQAHHCVELAHQETEEVEAARKRLERFAASLPAPRSGLWPLVPLAAIVVLAQVLSPIGASFGPIATHVKEISSVATLDPTKLSAATNTVMHSSLIAVIYIAWVFAVSTLVVQWPRRRAFRVLRALLGVGPEYRGVSSLNVRAQERAVFERANAKLPNVGSFDLVVASFGAVALMLMGADLFSYIVSGYDELWQEYVRDAAVGSVLVGAGVALLLVLHVQHRRRRTDGTA